MTPGADDLARALLQREAQRARLGVVLLFASAAIVGAWMRISGGLQSGALTSVILRFDRTLAVVAAVIAIMRVIDHLRSDHTSDWMLQLVAAGGSRTMYAVLLPLCTAAGMIVPYAVGAIAFGATLALSTGSATVLRSVLVEMPAVLVMFVSAASFATALAALWPDRRASFIAVAFLVAPWLGLLFVIGGEGSTIPASRLVTALGYPPPPLYVSYSATHLAYVVTYIAIMLAFALAQANRRVGRRA